jgi:hypothetical protein
MAQHVGEFRSMVDAHAVAMNADPGWVAARLVGRWPSGAPVVLSPDRDTPEMAGDERLNGFAYAEDPLGTKCPLGAHIRRSNPRDGLEFGERMSVRHRMIRRGLPYGPVLSPGEPDDGQERGLVFIAYVADIARQFEFVNQRWCMDGDAFGLGTDADPLIGRGAGSGKMTIPGSPPVFVAPLRRVVTVRGGEYLFVPGIRALEALVS